MKTNNMMINKWTIANLLGLKAKQVINYYVCQNGMIFVETLMGNFVLDTDELKTKFEEDRKYRSNDYVADSLGYGTFQVYNPQDRENPGYKVFIGKAYGGQQVVSCKCQDYLNQYFTPEIGVENAKCKHIYAALRQLNSSNLAERIAS